MLTCTNIACGKVFSEPLTTLNFKRSSKEHYTACPYCLTEITIDTESSNPPEKIITKIGFLEEKPSQNQEELSNCSHYFGYMSMQEHKKQMPEECMLCSQILECMVKENTLAKDKT
jgi:hypothetical protein